MAILTGFPPSNSMCGPTTYIKDFVPPAEPDPLKEIISKDFSDLWVDPRRPCPKILEQIRKQNERVRAALVVYSLNVMEDLGIESTSRLMQDCIDVGEEMYARYSFEKHGPYGDYIQGHLRRLLQEKGYYAKVASHCYFG